MKTSFAVLFLALAAQSVTGEPVGLRVVHNHGVPVPGATCTDEESDLINAKMYAAVTGSVRELRTGRQVQVNCNSVCRGFPPGQCRLAYPTCPNRRLYDDEEPSVQAPEVDPIGEDRLLQGEDLLAKCDAQKEAVIEVMHGGLAEVSASCNNLLKEHIDLTCFKL